MNYLRRQCPRAARLFCEHDLTVKHCSYDVKSESSRTLIREKDLRLQIWLLVK